jgi:hypothetical protein
LSLLAAACNHPPQTGQPLGAGPGFRHGRHAEMIEKGRIAVVVMPVEIVVPCHGASWPS